MGIGLSNDEVRRYSRHLIMPEVGLTGQKKLKAASVLCIGVGGLGSPLAMYLAAAGVGRIGLDEFDSWCSPRDRVHSDFTIRQRHHVSIERYKNTIN